MSADQNGTLSLWDIDSRTLQKKFEGHMCFVIAIKISPDGQTHASGSWDRTKLLWDLTPKTNE